MPYKKYIKRGGKVYGPYIYHSKRVGGKVVSEYHGISKKKTIPKRFLWISLGIVFTAVLVLWLSLSQYNLSGKAILDFNANYKKGEVLDGSLKLSLKEGEFIPASTKLILGNSGKDYEYVLQDVVSDEVLEGRYYFEGASLSGIGEGYGKEGIKEIYPTVYFLLDIYSEKNISEKNASEITGEQQETVGLELQIELEGEVTADNPFIYSLEEGQTAEIRLKSVRTEKEELSDSIVDLEVIDNEIILSTDYSEEKKGFGEDYLGDISKTLNVDLSDLNLILEEGELKVKLVYSGEEILFLTTVLQEGSIEDKIEEIPEIKKNIPEEEIVPEKSSSDVVLDEQNLSLTDNETAILLENFGTLDVQIIRQVVKDDVLIVGFEYGGSKEEHYYDYSFSEEIIKFQVEEDKIKLLKERASLLLKKRNNIEEQVSIIQ